MARGEVACRTDNGRTHLRETRSICVVPRSSSPIADELREHFDSGEVLVVVEARRSDRRVRIRRDAGDPTPPDADRRRVRSDTGRRLFERRGLLVAGGAPKLPPRLRGCTDGVLWFEHVGRRSSVADDAQMARLVARFQAGDEEAFVELYLKCFDRVYGFLNLLLRDHHAAEDAAQQTFVKAYQALPAFQLRAETPFRAWLLRIARNEGLGHLRKLGRVAVEEPQRLDLRRERPCADVPLTSKGWLSDTELMRLVERLPEAQRQVLALRYMLGLKTDELAAVVGRTPQAVRKLEHRALRFLEQRLQATRAPVSDTRLERASSLIRLRRAPVLGARRWALALSRPPMYMRPRAW